MRVALAYDLRDDYRAMGYGEEEVAEFDSVETIEAIEASLSRLGYSTERIGSLPAILPRLLSGERWDIVFNITEGLYGIAREAQVPAILDAYRLPYTFSDASVLALTMHKALCKRVVRDLGLPTPDFVCIHSPEETASIDLSFPLFVKPLAEGTGKGVSAASVTRDRESLETAVCGLLERYRQPVLVERYLPGREFTVGIVGTGAGARVIGVAEIILNPGAEEAVYSLANKELCEERVSYKLVLDPEALMAADCALAAWRGLECRDAGRIDLRSDAEGRPGFIEVNPLAGLHPTHSDLPIIATLAGMEYDGLIETIMNSALARLQKTGGARIPDPRA
ncbi:MAG TPA: D-alanine--D-alanine ligase [Spirochaetota bacterium]|nr:D-alanine--D-alanine ligase [Spirochaetota bacterium]